MRQLEVAPRGEAVVDAGTGGAHTEDGVAFGKPIGKFGADEGVDFDDAIGIAGLPVLELGGKMDMGGTFAGFGREVVDGSDDALGIEMPFDEEAIGGDAAVKRARGDAVEIGNVAAADGAEAIDIEMSVFGFKRVEGPFDEANAAAESVFALEELKIAADATIAVGGKNAGHVRVEIGSLAVETDVGLGETHHGVAIEGAENLATGHVGDHVSSKRLGVEVVLTPNLAGNLNAAVEFVEGVKGAD
jgi:hypothetical protein